MPQIQRVLVDHYCKYGGSQELCLEGALREGLFHQIEVVSVERLLSPKFITYQVRITLEWDDEQRHYNTEIKPWRAPERVSKFIHKSKIDFAERLATKLLNNK